MSTDRVWPAVQELAELWTESPVVQAFLDRHPTRNDRDDVVTEALRNLQAGASVLTEAPLWTSYWEPIAQQLPLVVMNAETTEYLRKVAPIGHAVELTVGWVRSRLPLYPAIPVPQFASRGYRRSPEFSRRLAWTQQFLHADWQVEPGPPNVHVALDLDPDDLADRAQNVLSAFAGSVEWQRYSELASALTEEDRKVLNNARVRVGTMLNPRRVDEYEPDRGERRNQFRRDRVAEVVAELDGRPKDLADAFEAIDDLIDDALIGVHGQLVVRGDLPLLLPTNLELDGPRANFDFSGDNAIGVGESVRLEDPLAAGAYKVEGMSFSFTQLESTMSYTARRLPGTEGAFGAG